MKRQGTRWWCGIASIANALEVLGIKRSQREIARLCDVSPEAGTSEVEMKRALLANGVAIDEYQGDVGCSAMWWLFDCMNLGPAILCVDDDDHWVTVIGRCYDRFILFDPSRNHGIEVHDTGSLAVRWQNSDGVFYALGVSPAR